METKDVLTKFPVIKRISVPGFTAAETEKNIRMLFADGLIEFALGLAKDKSIVTIAFKAETDMDAFMAHWKTLSQLALGSEN
jgi:hypothetical protein